MKAMGKRINWWATTCSSRTRKTSSTASGTVANSILIKLNQIGTVSETLETVGDGPKGGGHGRSSPTVPARRRNETFIADLAVGKNAGQIKTWVRLPLQAHRQGTARLRLRDLEADWLLRRATRKG